MLSPAADVVAALVLRGQRWASWVLLGLSAVAALGGTMWAYYVLPLLVTIAAIAVTVLLLLPEARRWARASDVPEQTTAH